MKNMFKHTVLKRKIENYGMITLRLAFYLRYILLAFFVTFIISTIFNLESSKTLIIFVCLIGIFISSKVMRICPQF
jgi:succinate-acetate transporter protein